MTQSALRNVCLYGDWNLDALVLHLDKVFLGRWEFRVRSSNFLDFYGVTNALDSVEARSEVTYLDLSIGSILHDINFDVMDLEVRGRVRNLLERASSVSSLVIFVIPFLETRSGISEENCLSFSTTDIGRKRSLILDEVSQAVSAFNNVIALYNQVSVSNGNLKQWVVQKSRYSSVELKSQARNFQQLVERHYSKPIKLLVCDLDNTLWGGVLGDDGPEGLRIGGHDPHGETFVLIQRTILRLKNMGLLLAICSKNEPKTVEHFFSTSDDMVLKIEDFVSIKCNWRSKADNIIEIANELNLSIEDFAFLDDSPSERALLSSQLPGILVLDNNGTPYSIFEGLTKCSRLHPLKFTSEDMNRSSYYLNEQERSKLKTSVVDASGWKKSLGMSAAFSEDFDSKAERVIQLLNKTNQFTALTRRMSLLEMREWFQIHNAKCIWVRAEDFFGDYGLIGFATFYVSGPILHLVDFVFSCRAIGRGLEELLMLKVCESGLRARGPTVIQAHFVRTPKNEPVRIFYEQYGLIGTELDTVGIELLVPRLRGAVTHIKIDGEREK